MAIERIYTTPGKLIKKYLAANGVSQIRLANLTGYSEKQISLILSDHRPVTDKFAEALEQAVPGTKKSFWLNYYQKYQKQVEEDDKILNALHYEDWAKKCSFDKLFAHAECSKLDRLDEVQHLIGSTSLNAVDSYNFAYQSPVSFLREDTRRGAANQTLLNLWLGLTLASNTLEGESFNFIGSDALKEKLTYYKKMFMISDPHRLVQCIQFFAAECGIKVIFTDSAPTTYVRGAAFSDNGTICVLLTSRYKTVEYTLFAFVHELFHIISRDVSPDGRQAVISEQETDHEDKVSSAAKEFFVNKKDYEDLLSGIKTKDYGVSDIFRLAQMNDTTPGMIVTFLQRDTGDYSTYRQFLHSFSLPD